MKKLEEIVQLDEIFDSHYRFEQHPEYKPREGRTDMHFYTKNRNHISVNINNFTGSESHVAHIMFDNNGAYNHEEGSEEGKHAHKIFGTIKKIVQHHLDNNPHVTHLEFSGSHEHPAKIKLYHHLAKTIDPNYKTNDRGNANDYYLNIKKGATT